MVAVDPHFGSRATVKRGSNVLPNLAVMALGVALFVV